MRIDSTGLPVFRQSQATSQQTGTGLCFEDLFLADSEQAPAQGRSSHTHSFNAFGLLGQGSTLGEGQADAIPAEPSATSSHPAGGKPYPASVTAALAQAVSFAAPSITPQDVVAVDEPVKAAQPAIGQAARPHSLGASTPGRLAVIPGFKAPPGLLYALIKASSLGGGRVDGQGDGLRRAGLFDPAADLPEPLERAQAEAAGPETYEVPAGADDVLSVAVSESDGVLHITAAAQGLSAKDRLKILGVAEEAAGETGARLGDIYLNGTAIRKFPRSFDRSFPWQLRL